MAEAGWYPDPQQPGQLRWFDGYQWSAHTQATAALGPAPASQAGAFQAVQTTYINAAPQKSVALALVLTFFFGPLGMLYSTIVGGLVMIGLNIVLGILTLGLWFIVAWPIQMIWAAVAASQANSTSPANSTTTSHVAMSYPQQSYVPPVYQAPNYPQQPGPPQQPGYPQQPTAHQLPAASAATPWADLTPQSESPPQAGTHAQEPPDVPWYDQGAPASIEASGPEVAEAEIVDDTTVRRRL